MGTLHIAYWGGDTAPHNIERKQSRSRVGWWVGGWVGGATAYLGGATAYLVGGGEDEFKKKTNLSQCWS